MFKKYQQLIFITVVLFALVGPLQAAEFSWQPAEQTVGLNQQFSVRLLLAAPNQPVNALSGQVQWPADLVKLVSVNQGNSIVPLWITLAEHNNSYEFSGLIPGGFDGMLSPLLADKQAGQILTLVFSAKQTGQGTIYLDQATVLLHDGQGTADQVTSTVLSLTVQAEAMPELANNLAKIDKKAPEIFTPQLIQNPDIFAGQWTLIFATQDKGSGLDYFSVQEGDEIFSPVTSPYLIKDQDLNHQIIVRAVDQVGNVQEVVVQENKLAIWYTSLLFYGIIIGSLLLAILLYLLFIKKKAHGGKRRKN